MKNYQNILLVIVCFYLLISFLDCKIHTTRNDKRMNNNNNLFTELYDEIFKKYKSNNSIFS